MRRLIDETFADEAEGKDKPVTGLDDWGLHCDDGAIFEAFRIWALSGYQAYPFPGSWFDQPWYVRVDFLMLMKVRAWHHWQQSRPTVKGLPRLDEH